MNNDNAERNAELRQWSYQWHGRGTIHTALEHINFGYTDEEADVITAMAAEGRDIFDMAKTLRRSTDDVFVITWDLAHRRKVKLDRGWLRS